MARCLNLQSQVRSRSTPSHIDHMRPAYYLPSSCLRTAPLMAYIIELMAYIVQIFPTKSYGLHSPDYCLHSPACGLQGSHLSPTVPT
eukprot:3912124-Amphidinium_carterae.1